MKKVFGLMAILAVALASCQNDQNEETETGKISVTSVDMPTNLLAANNGAEQEVGKFKFVAIGNNESLTELYIYNYASGAIDASADARVSSIKLYDGTTLISSFTPVLGGGKFVISGDKVKIAAGQSKILTIKVILNSIFNDAASTNATLAYAVTGYKYSSGGVGNIQGSDGGSALCKASQFIIRKTVPTVTYLDLPDKALNAGVKDIAKLSISADAAGDVTLKQIVLDVTATANTTLSAATTAQAVKINGTLKAVAISSLANGKLTIVFNSPEVISAGTSKTFEIQANTSVTGQGSDSITAKISEDGKFATDGSGNLVWSDGADSSYYTWANSYHINGLTTSTWTLSR